tara:strand:- start:986 stop:1204 length:219 start_codon:yes stop_codon:yes gene_type:complete
MAKEKKVLSVHVGYLIPNIVLDRLQELGWRIAHNTPETFEFRKQDSNDSWTVKQGTPEWELDFAEANRGVKI